MKTKDSKILREQRKKVSSSKPPTRRIRNVSLQSWTIPAGPESIFLTPGSAVEVPVSYINQRMRNLEKRRLIHISWGEYKWLNM